MDTREIYWNVGHGVALPMYLFTLLTALILAYGFYRRFQVYRQGHPLPRRDQLVRRITHKLQRALFQLKVMRVKVPGITHAFLFWGMLILFIGTVLVMIQVDFTQPLFGQIFLIGTFYRIFSLSLDLAGIIAIGMLLGFAVRRFIYRPEGLKTGIDDIIAHLALAAILVTGFLIEGARMAVTELDANPVLAWFSPVGRLVALAMSGIDTGTLQTLHRGLWWFHLALTLGLIASLPAMKLRHLFTTPTNYLFRDLRPKGAINTPNLAAEGVDRFGAEAVRDLFWKDIYDADACMSCKRCQERCPAWVTGKPLSPMRIVQQIGETAFATPMADLIATCTPEALWACTTCRACQDICPADIEHVNKILEMRRALVLMRGEFPGPEVVTAVANLEVNSNPFGLAFARRGDWAEGLPVQQLGDGGTADILYFVGCYASFDKRNQQVARSFVRVLEAAGVSVAILGKAEKCCGEPLRKLGNEYLYQMVAADNIERIKASGARQVVTTCPHCFNTLGVDYRDMGFDLPVEHYTVFLERLVREGRLAIDSEPFPATYHDSCYLSRYRDILREPRRLLRGAGGQIKEMRQRGYDTFCCGGGGALVLAEEKTGARVNVTRVMMAKDTGAPLMVSSCPFCLTMFEDGIKTGDQEGQLQVRDLVEILDERVKA